MNTKKPRKPDESSIVDKKRKDRILTELYETGRLNGLYFGKAPKAGGVKNPIKYYISSCLFKNQITLDSDLIDDCYNEAFVHLCDMPATKICDMYDLNPSKLIATTLKIISLKCFAIDPRYGNPHHSLIQSLLFCSAWSPATMSIDQTNSVEEHDSVESPEIAHTDKAIAQVNPFENPEEMCEFEAANGFTVEELLGALNPKQAEAFHSFTGKQARGKQPRKRKVERIILENEIQSIGVALSYYNGL